MSLHEPTMPDIYVGEFLALAESASVYFDIVGGRLTMRAANPNWRMWSTCRHLLDEIGTDRIFAYLEARQSVAA